MPLGFWPGGRGAPRPACADRNGCADAARRSRIAARIIVPRTGWLALRLVVTIVRFYREVRGERKPRAEWRIWPIFAPGSANSCIIEDMRLARLMPVLLCAWSVFAQPAPGKCPAISIGNPDGNYIVPGSLGDIPYKPG